MPAEGEQADGRQRTLQDQQHICQRVMDELTKKAVQIEAANALLDLGVSVPLMSVRLPFTKKRWTWRVTMRRPTMARQIKIARVYISMGVTAEEIENLPIEKQMVFMALHGKKLSRLIALAIDSWVPTGFMSWVVRHWMEYKYQIGAVRQFVALMGTDPFIPIIRSAERTNPMRLRLSHKKKGS